jgi:haloalkane dehalogenase
MPGADWIDRNEYPFASHHLPLPAGRMHFLDEGAGSPIVMVHGTPDWSFGYRKLVKNLSPEYRCVVPDNLGFGLSDKPRDWSYLPEHQAGNLRALIEHLDLKQITLVLHDSWFCTTSAGRSGSPTRWSIPRTSAAWS